MDFNKGRCPLFPFFEIIIAGLAVLILAGRFGLPVELKALGLHPSYKGPLYRL
jgi:hypothetical protein